MAGRKGGGSKEQFLWEVSSRVISFVSDCRNYIRIFWLEHHESLPSSTDTCRALPQGIRRQGWRVGKGRPQHGGAVQEGRSGYQSRKSSGGASAGRKRTKWEN